MDPVTDTGRKRSRSRSSSPDRAPSKRARGDEQAPAAPLIRRAYIGWYTDKVRAPYMCVHVTANANRSRAVFEAVREVADEYREDPDLVFQFIQALRRTPHPNPNRQFDLVDVALTDDVYLNLRWIGCTSEEHWEAFKSDCYEGETASVFVFVVSATPPGE